MKAGLFILAGLFIVPLIIFWFFSLFGGPIVGGIAVVAYFFIPKG